MQGMGQRQTGRGARCSARRRGEGPSAGGEAAHKGAPTTWKPCASGPSSLLEVGSPVFLDLPRPRECSQHSCVTWGRQPSALLDHCPSLGALSLSLSLEEAQRRLLRGGGHVETEHGPLETPPRGARSPPRGSGLPDPLLSTPLSGFAGRGSETTPSPPHSSAGWTSETRAAAGHPGETPPQPAAGQPLAVTSHARETECFSGVSPY